MNRHLPLFATLLLSLAATVHGQEVLPGICINSRQPVRVYLNNALVCENSLNCVIVNLRPLALYQIEVKDGLSVNPDAKPLFSDRVKAPEQGIFTLVVRGSETTAAVPPAEVVTSQGRPNEPDVPADRTVSHLAPAGTLNPNRPRISEDAFDELIGILEKATPDQINWIVEGRLTQNRFLVKHVKQLAEQFYPTDDGRVALVKKMYTSIDDRENAFQLVNSVTGSASRNDLAEFIAKYNSEHPL